MTAATMTKATVDKLHFDRHVVDGTMCDWLVFTRRA